VVVAVIVIFCLSDRRSSRHR